MSTANKMKRKTAGEQLTPMNAEAPDDKPNKKVRTEDPGPELSPLQTLQQLDPIPMVTGYATGESTAEVGQVSLGALFGADIKISRRLEKFAIAPNVPGLINIATIKDFSLFQHPGPSKFGQVTLQNNKQASCVFFTGGVVTRCNLTSGEKSRQICVAPIGLTWSRVLASMGKMVGLKNVAIATYMNGVSYSTKMKVDPNRQRQGGGARMFNTTGPSGKTIRSMPGGPLEWDTNVPMFDGREPFKLENFAELPKIREELDPGSFVLVTYSIGTYENASGNARAMYNVMTRLSLNVQHVILLAKPCDKELDDDKVLDPGHAGVLSDTDEEEPAGTVEVGDESKDFVL